MRGSFVALSLSTLLGAFMTASPALAQGVFLPALSGGNVNLPVTSIQRARQSTTLLQQHDFSCGSAALATLLTHHYGYPVTEREVFESMYSQGDQAKIRKEGFSLLDMKIFLQAQGFEADGFEQPLDKLLEARVPAIVLINENGYNHFVVIKGLQEERVLIGDPASGTRAVARQTFESLWKSRLLFVIHNRMELARFNLPSDWRVVPHSPLPSGIGRDDLTRVTLPKNGPGDF